ncbi:MAG: phenylalanine--tRNA ligase subunit beta [Lachnospiraceae bacterium]|nr:phenylalanine--tRNA ligase subunit beta [Lachnospiraceae bacterium]
MNTPLSWIRDYVPALDCTAKEYADRMTLAGTKVESFTVLDRNLKNIVVGRLLSVEPHPDATKLVVCRVNVGSVRADGVDDEGNVQIVTGAPNITPEVVGALIPVVLDGGMVAGGHDGGPLPEAGVEIHTGKLRGVTSYGMMCSVEELGSDHNAYPLAPESGIYIFDDALIGELGLKPGDNAVRAFGMDDTVVEYEITSNRVDCYSVIGIAREAAAVFDKPFIMPKVKESGSDEQIGDFLKVSVEDPELCPRYTARMVRNIRFAPSPEWMQKRLRNAGIRPINNLVDITNFVMLEYGQPMHAFDFDTLEGHEIIVKTAKDGDQFQTLDGQIRSLDHTVLMINDGVKAVGIAGIMGGENSKITDSVHNVVFESANFNGVNIRLSAKKIGMRTDASSIFEKGLDPATTVAAVNRACELVEELNCGEVVGGMIDIYPVPETEKRIVFEPERINDLLGTKISREEMLAIFRKLELAYDEASNAVLIPSFRRDLLATCDLAEEVLRFHGYDKIEDTLPVGEATTGKLSWKLRVDAVVRDTAEFAGFNHAMTYAFESPKALDLLNIPADDPLRKAVVISNPLGEDFSIMRTQPLNAMLTALGFNFNHRNENVWLYDMANIYLPKALPLTELPDEREQLCLGGYGDNIDFFVLKGVLEEIFSRLGMTERYELKVDCERPYLHPGRKADIYYAGELIGYIGEVHPSVAANYDFKPGARVCIAVLDMPVVTRYASFDRRYEGVARFPAVSRDISMLVPKSVMAGDIEHILLQRGGKLLESFRLFDIYEGMQVQQGFKSMAYALSFRAKDHTLKDDEVNSAMKKILNGLSGLGCELRS